MPFLPSEAEETKLVINNEMKDVLVFHYLPILWYKYPIPNNIREFWYENRPDILEYMKTAYQDLNLIVEPDKVKLQELQSKSIAMLHALNFKMEDNQTCHTDEFHNFCHSLFRAGIIEHSWPGHL